MNDRAVYTVANALDLPIADKSVQMIATSPPYFGLRDYGVDGQLGAEKLHDCLAWARGDEPCGGCYVCNMRAWAREMWRVLSDTGCMFLNLGDSYANSGVGGGGNRKGNEHGQHDVMMTIGRPQNLPGLKPKDLIGIPWRVALALQADGWYLRSDVIWAKPNPMPESVTDRPTKSHEYIFVLTKSARYFWDPEAVKEESIWQPGMAEDAPRGSFDGKNGDKAFRAIRSTRNLRTVWSVATAPYAGAHFATWPPALVERMIKAGTSKRGACPECGKQWERVVEHTTGDNEAHERPKHLQSSSSTLSLSGNGSAEWARRGGKRESTGWRPTCDHNLPPIPSVVLDPFAGSGTTLMVARQLGRIGLGFDLSETYLRENAAVRLGHDRLQEWGRGIKDNGGDYSSMPLFSLVQGD